MGLFISSESSKLELEGESDSESSLMTYGVMARYYFGESGLFGEASYAIGTQDDGGDDIDISGLGIGVGYALFLSDWISILSFFKLSIFKRKDFTRSRECTRVKRI